MVFYASPIIVGTDAVSSLGDGYTINVKWFQAAPSVKTNKILYHIYYSTDKDNVFSDGVKYISYDGSLNANIINLIPGQLYFFAVRPVEYNPSLFDVNSLPLAYDNLKFYPTSLLRANISSTDLIIPLIDVEGFPNTGIIKIGVELIQYLSVDTVNNNLILTNINQRGVENTYATQHNVDGYDGYTVWDPIVSLFTLGEAKQYDRIYACQSRFDYPNWTLKNDGYHQVEKDLFYTDLTASDEANTDFPVYDYAGYHRTDPVLLLNGACVGSYIGGEMGCIDGYGNVNILRGLSVQDHNNQRQEILLSVTGRPAVLIHRVRTGVTCNCYLPSSEYQDDRCPYCFAEGTLIRSENGLVPIETIKIGDKVLSSDGKYHTVTQVFKTPFTGKLKSITTTTTSAPILTTADHPFLKMQSDHKLKNGCGPNSNCKEYIKRGDGETDTLDIQHLPSGKWHARVQVRNHKRKVLGSFTTKEEAINAINEYKSIHSRPAHRMEWIDAKFIDKNDWLTCKWNLNIQDLNKIKIPEMFIKNTKLGSQRLGAVEFNVDEEFLWVIGLYIAEGSSGKRSISFALHKNETIYQDKLINFFKKYGFNPKLYPSKISNGACVEVHSTSLAKWFPYLCGSGCNNKKIPEEFMNLPHNKTAAIIQGIWDGDGSKRENEVVQTSEILCLQMAEILHRIGKQPLISFYNSKHLTENGNKRKKCYRINWEEDTLNRQNRRGRWKFYEQLLTKVKKVEEVDYSGYVYNLEVAGDHTYVVQNILVHNCMGTKFVVGYQQYFNPRRSDGRILVRPEAADETAKMNEAGLESEFPLGLWTLTVPTIKQRDIIVLFDINDNEEFRYEVTSVTRNNTTIGQQGGQKFKAVRIRKYDPAYQIRIFRNTAEFPQKYNTSIGFGPGIPPHSHEITGNQTSPSNWSQNTTVVQGHNHTVIFKNGVLEVLPILGHTHTVII